MNAARPPRLVLEGSKMVIPCHCIGILQVVWKSKLRVSGTMTTSRRCWICLNMVMHGSVWHRDWTHMICAKTFTMICMVTVKKWRCWYWMSTVQWWSMMWSEKHLRRRSHHPRTSPTWRSRRIQSARVLASRNQQLERERHLAEDHVTSHVVFFKIGVKCHMYSPLVETDGIYWIFNDSINSGQYASSWQFCREKTNLHAQLAERLKQISLIWHAGIVF